MPADDRAGESSTRATEPATERTDPDALEDLDLTDVVAEQVTGGAPLPGIWQNHNEVLVTSAGV